MSQGLIDADVDVKTVTVEAIVREADGVVSLSLSDRVSGQVANWTAGAHIDVILPGGLERQYSLCGSQSDTNRWRIAVLEEPASRGGSRWIHHNLEVGAELQIRGPRNNFDLAPAPSYLFIAGGIGITPILPMIQSAEEAGAGWRLLYGGRRLDSMAFHDELAAFGDKVDVRPQDEYGLLDLEGAVRAVGPGTLVYCCGPEPLIAACENVCDANESVELHVERFSPKPNALGGENWAFEVELRRRGVVLQVAAEESIVECMARAGISHPTSCAEGICGTCETDVLEGDPEHRDSVLSDAEKERSETMMVCCSRAVSSRLVLDL